MHHRRVAVVDIGSNTATLAVFEGGPSGGLDRVLQVGESLRLIRRLGPDRRLPATAIDRTLELVKGFRERAREHGAEHLEVVCTSAVRDAVNQDELLGRLRQEMAVPVVVLDGESEGVGAVVSAVHTLPLTDGFVCDLGGGSLQVAHVTTRRARQVQSLPLGALRLTDRFFTTDPPTADAVTALRRHVQAALGGLGWFSATAGGQLVGVGGGLRVLAKIDRRARAWPVHHGHGYRLSLDTVEATWERVSRQSAAERATIPGVAAHRVDTVCASALVAFMMLRHSGFDELRVSSYGIREGVALRRLYGDEGERTIAELRLASLAARLPPVDPGRAAVALAQVRALAIAADLERWTPTLLIATQAAVSGLRPVRSAEILESTPLHGFWQDDVVAAIELVREQPVSLPAELAGRLRGLVAAAAGAPR